MLNDPATTVKQRGLILPKLRHHCDLDELPPQLEPLGAGIDLAKPNRWYPWHRQDRNLDRLIDWLLSGESSGKIAVRIKETDGSIEHHLLFDCDNRWIYDSSPKFGPNAHPLTAETCWMMDIAAVFQARKIINNCPKRLRDRGAAPGQPAAKRAKTSIY